MDFLLGTHEFLGNHSFAEFLIGYIFGGALIIGAPTVFLLLVFTSALMKTNGKMGGYKEYETYGKSSLNVSTATSFIIAANDITVAKHGNKASEAATGGSSHRKPSWANTSTCGSQMYIIEGK